jgi:flagellar motility protein MotE (MotC chaperone)
MKALQARVQTALGGLDEKADADTAALVSVYEKMKPKAAAAVMETLDDEVALRVARRMKVATLATIMSSMAPARAKHLTEMMARRVDAAKKVAESAIAGSAAPKPKAEKPAQKKSAAAAPPAAAPPTPGA